MSESLNVDNELKFFIVSIIANKDSGFIDAQFHHIIFILIALVKSENISISTYL
jgi:hypothetical protein